jgi:hypothetical protein
VAAAEIWGAALPGVGPPPASAANHSVLLSPHRTETDGFFFALLRGGEPPKASADHGSRTDRHAALCRRRVSCPKLEEEMVETPTRPIELHYWPTPNGWKITVMLEELGVPYELRMVNIGKGEQFAPEFLAIAPNNRMPAIVDPDGPGGQPISVFESGAILLYLGRKFGRFYPSTSGGASKSKSG